MDKFEKQPAEVQDYDIDFTDFILSQGEAVTDAHTIDAVPDVDGITIDSFAIYNGTTLTNYETGQSRASCFVKVWVSAGTSGTDYKITARIETAGGRKHEHEIVVKVRER